MSYQTSESKKGRCSVIGFDPIKLLAVNGEAPSINTGWQYDDDLIESLGNANEWHKAPELRDKGAVPDNQEGLRRWLMESAAADGLFRCSVVDLETSVIDTDTVHQFRSKGMAVGAYTLFPIDLSATKRKIKALDDPAFHAEGVSIIRSLLDRKIDWMETDDVETARHAIQQIQDENKMIDQPSPAKKA
eukprot:gene2663-3338_t